jgi:chemotaxis protein MotA
MSALAYLMDPVAGSIVVGGSAAAAMIKCGWSASRDTGAAVLSLARPRFDAARQRAAIAPVLRDIQQSGLLRAAVPKLPDLALQSGLEEIVHRRDPRAFQRSQSIFRETRVNRRFRAVDTLDSATELAPVLGLAGTLLALSQLDPDILVSPQDMLAAISVAILSTLYGLLMAHFVYSPLARAVERRGKAEEEARSDVNSWVDAQIAMLEPLRRPLPEAELVMPSPAHLPQSFTETGTVAAKNRVDAG